MIPDILRHIGLVLSVSLLLMAGGCASGADAPDAPDPDPGLVQEMPHDVLLDMSLRVLDPTTGRGTRAEEPIYADADNYLEGTVSEYEKIKTLRVIIVRGNRLDNDPFNDPTVKDSTGYIEHNRFFQVNGNGTVKYDHLKFKIRSGEKKKIYFIVNEALVEAQNGIDFDKFKVKGIYDGSIEGLTLARPSNRPLIDNVDESNENKEKTDGVYIPMGECFDIDIPAPKSPDDLEVEMNDFFVVRAAVKFSFDVDFTGAFPKDESDWHIKDITVHSLADKEYFLPHDTEYQDVTDNANGLVGKIITNYSTPADMKQTSYTFAKDISYSAEPEKCRYAPAFYFPESAKDAEYNVSITLAKGSEENEVTSTLGPVKLPNLPSLPRNTHVVVKISFDNHDMKAEVVVAPYTAVTLNPSFGL